MVWWRSRARASIRDHDLPLWRQALEGIGFVTAAALTAVAVGWIMSVVVAWLF